MFSTRAAARDPAGRFSLLLLDDAEDYVDDFVAVATWPRDVAASARGEPAPSAPVPGRLRLASRSLLFDPDDVRLPIVRLPLASVTELDGVAGAGGAPALRVATPLAVRQKAGGVDAPYEVDRAPAPRGWAFALPYAPLDAVLPTAARYLALSRAPRAELPAALAAAAAERAAAAAFDPSRLVDYGERLVADVPARLLSPLVGEAGRAALTDARLYFEPLHVGAGGGPRTAPLASVAAVVPRRCSVADVGLELFFVPPGGGAPCRGPPCWGTPSALFSFATPADRDAFAAAVTASPALGADVPGGGGAAARAATAALTTPAGRAAVTGAWRRGALSNLDYLLLLNVAGGRSFQDVRAWPVVPWVVADYVSPTLDLAAPATFRDLSRPMGALDAKRLASVRERMAAMPPGNGADAPFLWGTHYSTAGYVMHFLLRSAPGHLLRLQGGRFDAPDRLFWSVAAAWASASGGGGADVRELTPEFYLPDDAGFLVNSAGLPLGTRQDGTPVDDVVLPPWAAGGAADFVARHRAALEAAPVSANLHHWIDLVFGAKQTGPAAVAADNVFHPLTYGDVVAAAAVAAAGNAAASAALAAQVDEFGQCPARLFEGPHPRRLVSPAWHAGDDWWTAGGCAAVAATTATARDRVGGARGGARVAALVARLGALLVAEGEGAGGDGVEEDAGLAELDVLGGQLQPEEAAAPHDDAATPRQLAPTPPPPASSTSTPPPSRWTARVGGTLTSLASSAASVAAAAATSGSAGNDGLKASLRGLFGGATGSPPPPPPPPTARQPPPVPRTRVPVQAAGLEGRLAAAAPGVTVAAAGGDLGKSATALAAATRDTDGGLMVYAGGGGGTLGVWVASPPGSHGGTPAPPAFRRARAARVAPSGTPVTALALLRSAGGRAGLPLALAGCGDGRLVAYSADAGAVAGARPAAHADALVALAVGCGTGAVVTGGWDGAVRVWSLAEGRHPWARAAPPPVADLAVAVGPAVWCAAVSADGRAVAAGSDDGVVRVWDVREPHGGGAPPRLTLPAGDDYVAGVGFVGGDDGALVVTCGSTLAVYDARGGGDGGGGGGDGGGGRRTVVPVALRCACVSGHTVAAGTDGGGVAVWHADSGHGDAVVVDVRHGAGVAAVALVGGCGVDGEHDALVTAHDDGAVAGVVVDRASDDRE